MSSAMRLGGLDALRIAALALVTWQHAATLLGAYAETQWRGISPGQTAVAIFCAIAGYLACRRQPASLQQWFVRRLRVVFPAYWLVTLAAFAMILVVPAKPISLGLFISQMLGLGYFTHGWDLVNVVSWFVSLILLCYVLTLFAWRSGHATLFWIATSGVCVLLLAFRLEASLSRHVLTYAVGAMMALHWPTAWKQKLLCLVGLLVLMGIGVSVNPQFFYAGVAGFALFFGVSDWIPSGAWIMLLSRYAYEYFLVHGIVLSVLIHQFSNAWLTIPAGIVLAGLIALVLAQLQNYLARWLFPSWALGMGTR